MNKRALPMARPAALILLLTIAAGAAESGKTLYENDFQKAAPGPLPENEFLVLDGDFSIKESDGNKYVELPGAPLDTFGVLFGPTTNDGVCVSARIYGTSKGRRFPAFGVGLNGQNGCKLKVSPAKEALEIYKGDQSVASVPYHWKTGAWTVLKLRIRQTEGPTWRIEGKAWPQTETEPKEWTITLEEKTEPHRGRASIWGNPFSGTPIRFSGLRVTAE
jgi:hypothetical protein